ncbi:hypothetical protein DdX_06729 [Ditylenchus destructor]|uniref:Uncharacterized protein n=1 Tax=Ditylenchus destructor TaxID=166010 RepID=A0AAD4R602_9BILA|nr:hypothetical protein DdX_06729 [Ditylenchus destructor]
MLSLLNKRAPSSSLAGFAELAVGIAWTSLLRKFASPDFAPYSSSDDANARGTFPGSFNSDKHRRLSFFSMALQHLAPMAQFFCVLNLRLFAHLCCNGNADIMAT